MDFNQKESFASNLEKTDTELYEKAMEIFVSYNPKIKVWIEDSAFDSFGRHLLKHSSIHTNSGFKGKIKWLNFFNTLNKRKLMAGEIKPKRTISQKIKEFLT